MGIPTAKFRNERTGDVLELPPPDIVGMSVVRLNGRVVANVMYSDEDDCVLLDDGRRFTTDQWSAYIVESLRTGAWRAD